MTQLSPVQHDSVLAPVAIRCRTGLTPLAVLTGATAAGTRVGYWAYVNGVLVRTATVVASSAGVVSVPVSVRDNLRSTVLLSINRRTVVNTAAAPNCQPAERGSASSYTLNHNPNGSVTRWNPCSGDIHVRVNAALGGPGADADTQAALLALGRATGLHLVYDGPTTYVPTTANSGSQPAAIVVAWAPPGTAAGSSDYFGAGAIGEGGWRSSGTSIDGGRTWNWKVVQGFVVIDPAQPVTPGFATGMNRGALLLHELGHVVGLGHTIDATQVMYGVLRPSSYASFGAGDLTGLKAVGATGGCTQAS